MVQITQEYFNVGCDTCSTHVNIDEAKEVGEYIRNHKKDHKGHDKYWVGSGNMMIVTDEEANK